MKKNFNRILALVLISIMLFTMCSCSKKSSNLKTDSQNGVKTWYLGGGSVLDDINVEELFNDVENKIDVDSVFSKLELSEESLHGVYAINNIDKDTKKLRKEAKFETVDFDNGSCDIYTLPVEILLGKEYICCAETGYDYSEFEDNVNDVEIAVLKFISDDSAVRSIFSYKIENNKMIFKQLIKTGSGEDFSYEEGNLKFEYEFSFKGPKITLRNSTDSIELFAYMLTDNYDGDYFELSGYSLPDSPLIDELDCFCAEEYINYAIKRNGDYYRVSAFKMSDDGLIDVYLKSVNEDGEETVSCKQYAYILRSEAGILNSSTIIFIDNDKICYYTDTISDREERELKNQGNDIGLMTDDEIKAIAQKKSDLFDDLQEAFKQEDIKVTINRSTGEIVLDTSVLFGGDSAVVTTEGKTFLNKFLKAYTSIIYNEKYSGFIAKTMIEGHVAPVNNLSYEAGLPFSQKRAESVKEYCLSGETGVDTSKLADSLETIGYSQSKPVYDSDGNVDFDASRRVSFRFIVNIEK